MSKRKSKNNKPDALGALINAFGVEVNRLPKSGASVAEVKKAAKNVRVLAQAIADALSGGRR